MKARFLKKTSTLCEVLLWNELKRNKLRSYDLHRQKLILYWIVDFFCCELMLVTEVDSEYHEKDEVRTHDKHRQESIEALGISFLRFPNNLIRHNIHQALKEIHEFIDNFKNQNCKNFTLYSLI